MLGGQVEVEAEDLMDGEADTGPEAACSLPPPAKVLVELIDALPRTLIRDLTRTAVV